MRSIFTPRSGIRSVNFSGVWERFGQVIEIDPHIELSLPPTLWTVRLAL